MPNNLYQQLNGYTQINGYTQQNSNLQQMINNFGGLQGLLNEYNKFKNSFQGNPQQIVQGLLQSGKMTQNEYNQLSQIASQFKNLLYKN